MIKKGTLQVHSKSKNDRTFIDDTKKAVQNVSGNALAAGASGLSAGILALSAILFGAVMPVGGIALLSGAAAAVAADATGAPGALISKLSGSRRKINAEIKGEDATENNFKRRNKADYIPFLSIARDKTYRLQSTLQQELYKQRKKAFDSKGDVEEATGELDKIEKLSKLVNNLNYFNVENVIEFANEKDNQDKPLEKEKWDFENELSKEDAKELNYLIKQAYRNQFLEGNAKTEEPKIDAKVNAIIKKLTRETANADVEVLDGVIDNIDNGLKKDIINKILDGKIKVSDMPNDALLKIENHLRKQKSEYLNHAINTQFLGNFSDASIEKYISKTNKDETIDITKSIEEQRKNLQISQLLSLISLDPAQRAAVSNSSNANDFKLNSKQKNILKRFNISPVTANHFKDLYKQNIKALSDNSSDAEKAKKWFTDLFNGNANDLSVYFRGDNKFEFGNNINVPQFLQADRAMRKSLVNGYHFYKENGKEIRSNPLFNWLPGKAVRKAKAVKKYLYKVTRECTPTGNNLTYSANRSKLAAFVPMTIYNAALTAARHIPFVKNLFKNSSVVAGERVIGTKPQQSKKFKKALDSRFGGIIQKGLAEDIFESANSANINNKEDKPLLLLNIGRAALPKPTNKIDDFSSSRTALISSNARIAKKAKDEDNQVQYLDTPVEIYIYGKNNNNPKKEMLVAAVSFGSKDLLKDCLATLISDAESFQNANKIVIGCGGFETTINKIGGKFDKGLLDTAVYNFVREEKETRIAASKDLFKENETKKARGLSLLATKKLINFDNTANTEFVPAVTLDSIENDNIEPIKYIANNNTIAKAGIVSELGQIKIVNPVIPALYSETAKALHNEPNNLGVTYGNSALSMIMTKNDEFKEILEKVDDAEKKIISDKSAINVMEHPLQFTLFDLEKKPIGVFSFTCEETLNAFCEGFSTLVTNSPSSIPQFSEVKINYAETEKSVNVISRKIENTQNNIFKSIINDMKANELDDIEDKTKIHFNAAYLTKEAAEHAAAKIVAENEKKAAAEAEKANIAAEAADTAKAEKAKNVPAASAAGLVSKINENEKNNEQEKPKFVSRSVNYQNDSPMPMFERPDGFNGVWPIDNETVNPVDDKNDLALADNKSSNTSHKDARLLNKNYEADSNYGRPDEFNRFGPIYEKPIVQKNTNSESGLTEEKIKSLLDAQADKIREQYNAKIAGIRENFESEKKDIQKANLEQFKLLLDQLNLQTSNTNARMEKLENGLLTLTDNMSKIATSLKDLGTVMTRQIENSEKVTNSIYNAIKKSNDESAPQREEDRKENQSQREADRRRAEEFDVLILDKKLDNFQKNISNLISEKSNDSKETILKLEENIDLLKKKSDTPKVSKETPSLESEKEIHEKLIPIVREISEQLGKKIELLETRLDSILSKNNERIDKPKEKNKKTDVEDLSELDKIKAEITSKIDLYDKRCSVLSYALQEEEGTVNTHVNDASKLKSLKEAHQAEVALCKNLSEKLDEINGKRNDKVSDLTKILEQIKKLEGKNISLESINEIKQEFNKIAEIKFPTVKNFIKPLKEAIRDYNGAHARWKNKTSSDTVATSV